MAGPLQIGVTPKQHQAYVEQHGCNYTDNGVQVRSPKNTPADPAFPDLPRYTSGMYKSLT